jgi:hypothetical protein
MTKVMEAEGFFFVLGQALDNKPQGFIMSEQQHSTTTANSWLEQSLFFFWRPDLARWVGMM